LFAKESIALVLARSEIRVGFAIILLVVLLVDLLVNAPRCGPVGAVFFFSQRFGYRLTHFTP
jgi:hypothetical protein